MINNSDSRIGTTASGSFDPELYPTAGEVIAMDVDPSIGNWPYMGPECHLMMSATRHLHHVGARQEWLESRTKHTTPDVVL